MGLRSVRRPYAFFRNELKRIPLFFGLLAVFLFQATADAGDTLGHINAIGHARTAFRRIEELVQGSVDVGLDGADRIFFIAGDSHHSCVFLASAIFFCSSSVSICAMAAAAPALS
jgi:hypothetical protein